ncbi:restriction endonuclease subunit S [Marinobacter sp. G11]|uniref:restriction endonuclease subunit S n=1 Tax=Marinobacter sp. G11 TaxID=2903522 RepID=UPI001E381E1A|nr:restriction endonuclease subunit S [Marinobacter sp. G11]MCE0760069.1 restriction endonuclease subunit S [Marinobacter sp. G11]
MSFETWTLEEAEIRLIDGDRGKNYPKQADFSASGHCLFLSAKNVTSSGFQFSDPVFIGKERHDLLRAGTLERGDIVMTTRGTIGNVAYYDSSVSHPLVRINSGMMIFRANHEAWNTRFLYYVLTSPVIQNQITNLTSGSAVPQLPARDLKKFQLPKVPLSVQNRIEAIISSLSNKLSLNHQINQTLEQMAQAIFKSWFVDFEPVKAKIAALEAGGSEEDTLLATMQAISGKDEAELTRLQTEQPEQYAELRATAELFPSAMQDSELGEIPEGWSVSQIGDEVTVVGGGTPSTKNPDFWENGEINWTSPKDLSNLSDKVLVETERKVTEAGLAKISSGLLPVDTVLMSSRAPVGYLALAKIPVAVNQGYIAMKCEKALSPEFVIQWCAAYMDEIKSRASGTTFAEISKKNFKIIPVVKPPEPLISVYSKQASSLYKAIENNLRGADTLAKLRDSLLPKLLSGELSVIDAEDQLMEEELMPQEEIN